MKAYEVEVRQTIIEYHYIMIDAESEEEASKLARTIVEGGSSNPEEAEIESTGTYGVTLMD